ncbi:monosaccharide ABC transporter substrate-binding protein, CUT2 family (TC 3.A.1.2.-) [Gracilibacillus ureilyticus]|uniref:Monosaccharide ABC transporter substrate-binding protein, CUT2 family (TC 3.A.1.2.-) n=1 Tax=Gracilibacillus ureilyticus TaxID=531814 RepID=A0A1H9U738_9BACI|nr:ABC transporter substrate-binding protein [Gracilibacillus ureilyticus]SES04954.1 monosaccharide ABC transporter substrate-binding protein, CUT2 family (TC 3.A.1.2.-) [Gracilibacillus ureilyticus]
MNRKFLALVIMVSSLVFVLAACGGDSTETGSNDSGSDNTQNEENNESSGESATTDNEDGETSEDKPYVAIISKGFQHQFWQAVQRGAEKAAEEFNVEITFEGPDNESQVDKQIEMLQTALDKNPDAIGFAALDSQAAAPLLENAKEKDIPVIAFDSGVNSDIPVTTASTDNYAAAAEAAHKMAELIGEEGKVALVVHDQVSVTGVQRRDGFIETMEKEYPNIEIADTQYGGGDHLESTNLAKAMMQAHPDLAGIYGTNEGSAIGVVNAVRELGKESEVTIVGFDSGKQQIDAIKDGVMAGAITQNPEGIGYETVKAAVDTLNGKEVPETIDTGFYWYDADNIDSEEIQAAIYE